MTDEDVAALTPESFAERTAGSKWVFVSEHSMILTIWSCKVCMLVLYASITEGLKQRKWVTWLGYWVILSFIGTELGLFLSCRPIQQYWAVPASDPQCSSYQHYEIILAVFNIPGDIAMLCIGLPIFMSIRLPMQQKLILLAIFGMGIFIIISSILTKIYCLVPSLISYVYMNWYFREASVAMYVTNLPSIWPLLRDIFPAIKSWGSARTSRRTGDATSKRYTFNTSRAHITSRDGHQLKSFTASTKEAAESQEHIRGSGSVSDSNSARSVENGPLEIHTNVTISVQTEDAEARNKRREREVKFGWEECKEGQSTTVVHAV